MRRVTSSPASAPVSVSAWAIASTSSSYGPIWKQRDWISFWRRSCANRDPCLSLSRRAPHASTPLAGALRLSPLASRLTLKQMAQDTQLIFGFHAVTARLRHQSDTVIEIYAQSARHDPRLRDLVNLAQSRGITVLQVDAQSLQGLSGGGRHQGVVARVEPVRLLRSLEDVVAERGQEALLLLLDGVTDPHNLGACLRVADAMAVDAVVAPKDRSVGITPTVSKVASGAAETVPFITITNLARTIEELQEAGLQVIGADEAGTEDLFAADLRGPLAWVLGAEGEGLRRLTRERCDRLVRIPMLGTVESLNVSVAAALCLYETRRAR